MNHIFIEHRTLEQIGIFNRATWNLSNAKQFVGDCGLSETVLFRNEHIA